MTFNWIRHDLVPATFPKLSSETRTLQERTTLHMPDRTTLKVMAFSLLLTLAASCFAVSYIGSAPISLPLTVISLTAYGIIGTFCGGALGFSGLIIQELYISKS